MILKDVVPSEKKDKRFTAIFKNGRRVDFGSRGGSTYIDHQDPKKRLNYVKRHRASGRENWNDPYSPGALAVYLLWGPNEDLKGNIRFFNNYFVFSEY